MRRVVISPASNQYSANLN